MQRCKPAYGLCKGGKVNTEKEDRLRSTEYRLRMKGRGGAGQSTEYGVRKDSRAKVQISLRLVQRWKGEYRKRGQSTEGRSQ